MDEFRKGQQKIVGGGGGMKCDCCNHFKGKDKGMLNRIARRQLKIKDMIFVIEEDDEDFNPEHYNALEEEEHNEISNDIRYT